MNNFLSARNVPGWFVVMYMSLLVVFIRRTTVFKTLFCFCRLSLFLCGEGCNFGILTFRSNMPDSYLPDRHYCSIIGLGPPTWYWKVKNLFPERRW